MTEKLVMAFIGFGKSTNRYHLPYIKLRENITVKRVVTPHLDKRAAEREAWEATGTTFSTDINTILDDPEINLVSIVTPAPSHFEFAKKVLHAGKNLVIDKPMVTSIEEAKELIALANEKGVMLMPFQNRRFDSDYLALQRVLKAGYVGRPLELEVHMDHYREDASLHTGEQIDGAYYGHGVHLLDEVVALLGKPEAAIYDLRATRNPASTIEDQFEVGLLYADGLKATVQATEMAAIAYPKWVLHGTKGSYIKHNIDQQEYDLKTGIMPGDEGFGEEAPQDFGKVKYQNQNGDWIEKIIPAPVGDYGRVYDAVYDTIINGAPKLVSDEQMLTVVELMSHGFDAPSPSVFRYDK